MANIPGTNLAAGIVPFTSDDTYPTHYAMYGKGGHRTVQSIVNRNSIPTTLKEEGMTVFVLDDNTKYTWKKNPNNNNIVEWLSDANINAVGANTQVIFNDNGVLAGNSDFTYDKATGELTSNSSKTKLSSGLSSFGPGACRNLNTSNSTFLGKWAGADNASGNENTFLGFSSGTTPISPGNYNLYAGAWSGRKNVGSNNIFLGRYSGLEETAASNKLIIESSRNQASDYLIEGDFSQRWVRFNGAVRKRVVEKTALSSALYTGTTTSATASTITDTNTIFSSFTVKSLIITGGTGIGQKVIVNSSGGNTLNLFNSVFTVIPDNTSTYKIIDTYNSVDFENFNTNLLINLNTEDYAIILPNSQQSLYKGCELDIILKNNTSSNNVYIYNFDAYDYGLEKVTTINTCFDINTIKYDGIWTINRKENKIFDSVKSTTKDIIIQFDTKIYKLDVSTPTTITLNFNAVNQYVQNIFANNALTIELHINMTAASLMTFPVNVSWVGGSAPSFNAINNYRIDLRTMNAGTTWLAEYKYTY